MKKILILCFANYCRSPVAEKILSFLDKEKNFEFTSAGIIDFQKVSMDPRSEEYLKKLGIQNTNHYCKKVNHKDFEVSDLVLPIDLYVLGKLIANYRQYKSKIKLFTIVDPLQEILDPYKFDDVKNYEEQLDKIYKLSNLWINKLND